MCAVVVRVRMRFVVGKVRRRIRDMTGRVRIRAQLGGGQVTDRGLRLHHLVVEKCLRWDVVAPFWKYEARHRVL